MACYSVRTRRVVARCCKSRWMACSRLFGVNRNGDSLRRRFCHWRGTMSSYFRVESARVWPDFRWSGFPIKNGRWPIPQLDFSRESDRLLIVSNGGIRSWKSETPGTCEVSYQSLG